MRFVFYTDAQLSGQTPRHRTDDYQGALVAKLEEVYGAAVAEKADFVVCGGDLFNSHRIFSYELLSPVMDVLCDCGLDTYAAVGQHDILGYNPTTYKSSTLAFVVQRCRSLNVIWDPVRVGDVQLVASHVWEDLRDAANHELDGGAWKVLVAHHLLTNKQTVFESVNTGEFAGWMREGGAGYDMVLSGDLHDGYDVHEVDGMWFCNPGSLARQAISDAGRMPRYAVVEVEPGEIPVVDLRDVKCARPGNEVFGETAAEVMRESADFDPTAFVREVEDFEVESADVHELVQKVGRAKGIRPEILAYIASKSEKTQ